MNNAFYLICLERKVKIAYFSDSVSKLAYNRDVKLRPAGQM